jgi:hypothetical protein
MKFESPLLLIFATKKLCKACEKTAQNLRISRMSSVNNPAENLSGTGGRVAEKPYLPEFARIGLTPVEVNTYARCCVLFAGDHKILCRST